LSKIDILNVTTFKYSWHKLQRKHTTHHMTNVSDLHFVAANSN